MVWDRSNSKGICHYLNLQLSNSQVHMMSQIVVKKKKKKFDTIGGFYYGEHIMIGLFGTQCKILC